jgi:hypothetical protein
MNADELYQLYSAWSGQLHFYAARDLHRQLNAEFFPAPAWEMQLSRAMEEVTASGIPRLIHIGGEIYRLPRPEENPSKDQLDITFRHLCLVAARVLEIDLSQLKVTFSASQESPPRKPCEKSTRKSRRQKTLKNSSGGSSSR